MGKPGAKKTDQIVSVTPGDIHIIMVPSPGGPVPTPIPHPCTSIIKDKVAKKVKVMGQPGATKGSISKHTPPHIPMGPGPFQKPPANKGEIVTASSNVFYQGKAAAMLGDSGKMCMDPSDAPVGKVIGTAATVLVGGGGSGSGSDGSGQGNAKKAGGAAGAGLGLVTPTGHPVDVATGNLIVSGDDLELDGPLPIQFVRTYVSATATTKGPLGYGWVHNFQESMELVSESHSDWKLIHAELTEAGNPSPDRKYLIYRDPNGLATNYRMPRDGEELTDDFHLRRLSRANNLLSVTNRHGIISQFGLLVFRGTILQLLEVVDRNGNKNVLRYSPEGLLTEIEDCYGRTLIIIYESQRITEIQLRISQQEAPKRWYSYKYDQAGDLVEVVDRAGFSTQFAYADHLIVQDKNREGYAFYFAYDQQRRCVKTWGQDGYLTRYLSYDLEKSQTREIDGEGGQAIYSYTSWGVVWQTERGKDVTGELTFDARGRTLSCSNGGEVTTSYEYDADGNLGTVLDGEDNATELMFNLFGQVVLMKNPLGLESTFEYDERGNMIVQTDPGGAITRSEYDRRGRLVRETQPDGTCIERTYDRFGHETRIGIGKVVTLYQYDELGNLLSETPFDGPPTTIEWNERGFPSCVRVGGVLNAAFEYDREGFITAVTDAEQMRREFSLGPPGVPVEISEYDIGQDNQKSLRSRLTIRIDTEGRPATATDQDGLTRHFEYDEAGRLIRETRQERSIGFVYDGTELAKTIDSNLGPPLHLEHDGRGLATRITYSSAQEDVFEYDELGRFVSGTNEWGEVRQEYDKGGATIFRSQGDHKLKFERDEVAGKLQLAVADELSIEYLPDSLGNLAAIGFGDKRIAFTTDDSGRARQRVFPNGITERRLYANREQLAEFQLVRGDSLFKRRTLEPGPDGRIASITDESNEIKRFEYDRRGRLVGVQGTPNEWYRYGNRDNLLACHHFNSSDVSTPDLLLRAGDRHYAYDSWKRVSSLTDPQRGTFSFHYDAKGQLCQVDLPDSGRVYYLYDVFGRRMEKRFEGGLRAGRKVKFFWNNQQLLKEEEWFREEKLDECYYLFLEDQPLARLKRREGTEEFIYYHNDHTGTPQFCTDEQGQVVWEYRGDLFGYEANGNQGFQNIRLPGQYYDEETGLHYNRYRYYDPFGVRYLQPDPLEAFVDQNRFTYPLNPLSFIDPLGLTSVVLSAQSQDNVVRDSSGDVARREGVGVQDLMGSGSFKSQKVDHVFIHAHGSPDSIQVSTPWRRVVGFLPGVSSTRAMSGKEVAQLLKKRGLNPKEVTIVACNVGKSNSTFAKEFAQEMGSGADGNPNVQVNAWEGPVGVMSNGDIRMLGPSMPGTKPRDYSDRAWPVRQFRKVFPQPPHPVGRVHGPGVGKVKYDATGKRTK